MPYLYNPEYRHFPPAPPRLELGQGFAAAAPTRYNDLSGSPPERENALAMFPNTFAPGRKPMAKPRIVVGAVFTLLFVGMFVPVSSPIEVWDVQVAGPTVGCAQEPDECELIYCPPVDPVPIGCTAEEHLRGALACLGCALGSYDSCLRCIAYIENCH